MSINNLFEKGNKFFLAQNHIAGLEVYKQIFFKYPKNIRLSEEIKKKIKKFRMFVQPTFSQSQIDKFFELHNLGKTNLVIQTLNESFKSNQDNVLSITLLGTFLAMNEEYVEAIKFQKLAVEKAPFEVPFYLNLSQTLSKIGRFQESLSTLYFAKVLSLNDKLIDYELAKTHTKLKNFLKADLIYQGLIKEDLVASEIIYDYSDNLIRSGKAKEAIIFLEKHQLKKPKDEHVKVLICFAYYSIKQYKTAKNILLEVTKSNNYNEKALTTLGNCYEQLGDLDQAKNYYNQTLKINPKNIDAINNLAAYYFYKGNTNEAINLYKVSLTISKNNSNTRYYLSLCQLSQSNYNEGWLNFDYRWLAHGFNSVKFQSNLPKFKLNNNKKNLLLWGEQGLGDQILFLRFIKDIKPNVNNLYIYIDKRLHPIIERFCPEIVLFNKDIHLNLDSQLSLGDLPALFVKNTSYFLNNKNYYLSSDLNIKKKLEINLKSRNKILCGISWTSNASEVGISKSITLEMLKPILKIENVEFVDLQYTETSIERENFYNKNNIKIKKIENIDNFNDLNGLTSLIDVCDFVITISNTNAHIAGSLGKRTFLLLPKGKGRLWYWISNKGRSVWYPKIDIIEQEQVGDWQPVIKTLQKKVKEHLIG